MARDRLDNRNGYLHEKMCRKALRQLLGEVDDPAAAYLGTIADLAQFTAVDDYFGTVAKNWPIETLGLVNCLSMATNTHQNNKQDSAEKDTSNSAGMMAQKQWEQQAVGRKATDEEQLTGRSRLG